MTYKNHGASNLYGSKEGYDKYAKFYDCKLDFLNSFEQGKFLKMMGDVRGKKVLDVGCGTGRLIKILNDKGASVTGADISPEMLKIAQKKLPKNKFVEADIEKLPFKDESFDMVVASFVIVHLKDLKIAFEEVYRVLKSDGIFIVTNINQRKAPKLEIAEGRRCKEKEIVIKSYYHIPEHVISALEKTFFFVEEEEFVYENSVWINQLIRAAKH